jgi:glycosyltransferase domain-containing protein
LIERVRMTSVPLTVILPTRNRARHCTALLRFFRDCRLAHPIVVADSSDPPDAQAIRDACAGIAEYRHFDPAIEVFEKFLATLRKIETPFVVTAPDDDVTFPHAIDAALAHLQRNRDFVAAHGYVLRFGTHRRDVDIHNVSGFAPTVARDDPLQRLYHLIRRYQPIIWAVFRTETFAAAMQAALGVDGYIFQELTFAATAALEGNIARLPVVFSMRGKEESMSALERIHPFFWFLRDADDFFAKYRAYRNALVQRIRNEELETKPLTVRLAQGTRALADGLSSIRRHGRASIPSLRRLAGSAGLAAADKAEPEQLVDLIHAIWLAGEIDAGRLNHAARRLMGEWLPPMHVPSAWPGWREPADGDAVRSSARGDRRYVWRREVLTAEPRDEITITPDEMARVERELDCYRLAEAAN